MKIDSYACDVCQVQKKAANHWWRGYKLMDRQGVVIIEWDGLPTADSVENFEAHLCGASCVAEWVSKRLFV